MKNFFKPARIGFYLLMLISFFLIGLHFAGFIDAGKGQGLAGGAIVLGYGIMFAGIAFVASFFIAHFLEISKIKIINWVLLLLVLGILGYTYYEFKKQDTLQKERNAPYQNKNTTPTETTEPVSANLILRLNNNKTPENSVENSSAADHPLGIGFFKHNFFEYPTLHFYGGITLEKGVMEHLPQDSLVMGRDQFGDFSSTYAPPYLLPEYMKLDYGIFYFKALGISHDFIKVEVNKQNGQAAYLNTNQGELLHWPAFLLTVNTVKLIENTEQTVKIKPLDNAGEVTQKYTFLKPILVQEQWMQVLLTDQSFKTIGKGWIRWQRDGKLLISFSYLS
tara:strand:- start:25969 stop:26973 length:1005 start_codon:yes stop_codon:yes gene_type:complete